MLRFLALLLAASPGLHFSLQGFSEADIGKHQATVLLFVATDCPNSNTYAPLLARMYREYAPRGVLFLGVYSDPSESSAAIARHDREYQIPYPGILDPRQTLARQTGARSTPEAVILNNAGRQVYRGRVDDRFVDIGKTRYRPGQSDLQAALEETLQGKPVTHPITKVLGCAIPGLNE